MMKFPVPGDLDFVPIRGGYDPNFIFGVVRRRIKNGPVRTVPASVLKRLCPGEKVDVAGAWKPSCYRWDVLLPPRASDELLAMRAPHLDAVNLIAKMAACDLAWGLMWLWTMRWTVLAVLWTMRRMVRARNYPVRRTVRM